MGAVRGLAGAVQESERDRFRGWMARVAAAHRAKALTGCGGNIRRLGKILRTDCIESSALESLLDSLKEMSPDARAARYGLRLDRADVIVPATEVYCLALRAGNFSALRIPRNAGLADGMLREMAGDLTDGREI